MNVFEWEFVLWYDYTTDHVILTHHVNMEYNIKIKYIITSSIYLVKSYTI